MQIDVRAPLVAEAIAWGAPEPTTSLIVKGTFRLESGTMTAAQTPRPLVDAERIPWKRYPEVLVVGHARAPHAQTCIDVSLRLGDQLHKTCSARAGTPTRSVPLRATHLRRDRQSHDPVRLGPEADTPPAWLQKRLPAGFDYAGFNVAQRDQWVSEIHPGATLELEGLDGRGEPLLTHLPMESPRVFCRQDESAEPAVVSMCCDTLWLDADAHIACLLWRAVVPRLTASASVLICWSSSELTPSEAEALATPVQRRGARAPATTVDVNEMLAAQAEALPFAPGTNTGYVAPNAPDEPVAESTGAPGAQTVVFDDDTLSEVLAARGDASPFLATDEAAPPARNAPVGSGTLTPEALQKFLGAAPQAASLPFKHDDDRPLPPHLAELLAGLPDDASGSSTIAAPSDAAREALPFERQSASPSHPAPPSAPRRSAVPSAPPQSAPARSEPPRAEAQGANLSEETVGIAMNFSTVKAAVPFDQRERSLPDRVATALAQLEDGADAGQTIPAHRTDEQEALPFEHRHAPVSTSTAPAAPRFAPPPMATPRHAPVPTAPHAPAPAHAPAPEPPPERPRLSLELMAKVRAEMLDGVALENALSEHRLEERVWRYSDRMLAIDIARERADGKNTLANQLDRQIAEATRTKAAPAEPNDDIELDLYLTVVAELDEADEPHRVLEDLGMTADGWRRMRRTWTRRALDQPELATRIRSELIAKRRALRTLD